jgi:hypothetical protein
VIKVIRNILKLAYTLAFIVISFPFMALNAFLEIRNQNKKKRADLIKSNCLAAGVPEENFYQIVHHSMPLAKAIAENAGETHPHLAWELRLSSAIISIYKDASEEQARARDQAYRDSLDSITDPNVIRESLPSLSDYASEAGDSKPDTIVINGYLVDVGDIKDNRLVQILLKAINFAWKPKRYGHGGMVLELFYKLSCHEGEEELVESYWWTESELEHYFCDWFPDSFGKELDYVIQEVLYELLPEFIETGHRDGDWIRVSIQRLDEE